jgi:hypothetical protein
MTTFCIGVYKVNLSIRVRKEMLLERKGVLKKTRKKQERRKIKRKAIGKDR